MTHKPNDGKDRREYETTARQVWEELYGWHPVSEKPTRRSPIEMTGDSWYVAPNDRYVMSGYYDEEYRPLQPWRAFGGDAVEAYAGVPTHWRYMTEPPYVNPREKARQAAFADAQEWARLLGTPAPARYAPLRSEPDTCRDPMG